MVWARPFACIYRRSITLIEWVECHKGITVQKPIVTLFDECEHSVCGRTICRFKSAVELLRSSIELDNRDILSSNCLSPGIMSQSPAISLIKRLVCLP